MFDAQQLEERGLLDIRAPRYASFPPVDRFLAEVGPRRHGGWLGDLVADDPVSVYVHVPFCKRLCWYCAYRTQLARNDHQIARYLTALQRELEVVSAKIGRIQPARSIHWGGGTPTVLTPDQIAALAASLERAFVRDASFSLSIEIDPEAIDAARVAALAAAGATRSILGVQDYEPSVQAAIGRKQSFETTADVARNLREAGIPDLTVELVYGLPQQTIASLVRTIRRTLWLKPDRIALYGYAHVPWISRRQVMIKESAVPSAAARAALFNAAAETLLEEGYVSVGMDHFARPGDPLIAAADRGEVSREPTGVVAARTGALLGLGASAVSRFPTGYVQNRCSTADYLSAIDQGALATGRGHEFTDADRWRSDVIENLISRFEFEIDEMFTSRESARDCAHACARAADKFGDLVEFEDGKFRILDPARPYARTIAREFDPYTR